MRYITSALISAITAMIAFAIFYGPNEFESAHGILIPMVFIALLISILPYVLICVVIVTIIDVVICKYDRLYIWRIITYPLLNMIVFFLLYRIIIFPYNKLHAGGADLTGYAAMLGLILGIVVGLYRIRDVRLPKNCL
jgi:hypothetical protein